MEEGAAYQPKPDLRLNRIIQRRRRLRWDHAQADAKSARDVLRRCGIVLIERALGSWLCRGIERQLPTIKPISPTRVIEPTHRQDLLLYPGGYVSQALRESWDMIEPILNETVGNNPEVVELSAMVSFPGAAQQAPHPDVRQAQGQAPMYSIFMPLTDQTYEMGPLLAWPGTHFGEPPELPMQDVVPMLAPAGSLIIMDSRLYHCGGANHSEVPRPVFYFTLRGDGPAPVGSTLSLLPDLEGSTIQQLSSSVS